jgi:hypothetical protein
MSTILTCPTGMSVMALNVFIMLYKTTVTASIKIKQGLHMMIIRSLPHTVVLLL